MANRIAIGDLSSEIMDQLKEYHSDVTNVVNKIADEVSDDLVTNTKKDANFLTGKYRRKIKKKKEVNTIFDTKYIWYVDKPSYRLTHLLAYQHRTKNGGLTKQNNFIDRNTTIAVENFERRLKNEI